MINCSLSEIEKMAGGDSLNSKYKDIMISGVSTDSRDIKSENLFIPLIGENFNGHEFIQNIIDKNVKAALWNRNEPLPDVDFPFILVDDTSQALQSLASSYLQKVSPKVIGITGTNGKTSTKDILASLLKTKYKTHKTKGNFNNGIGLPLTVLAMEDDTEMIVLEMGMDAFGQIELLTKIAPPDAAIITNIGTAHLEGLITRENIAKAKLEILKGLKDDGFFVYYGDDDMLKLEVASIQSNNKVKTFGINNSNHYQPEIISMDETGILFRLESSKTDELFLPMLGVHQMLNATAAIAIAEYFGITSQNIKKGLLNIEKTGMRNELVKCDRFTILDDSYKSNPESVRAALETLYAIKGYSQKIAVLGDMLGLGDGEIDMHREIGSEISSEDIDYLFTIGEFGKYIYEAAKSNFSSDNIFHFEDKDKLAEKIKKVAKANSLILVKASRSLAMEEVVDKLKN